MLLVPNEQPVWTEDEVKKRLKNERMWTEAQQVQATIVVQGWKSGTGKLWEPGKQVSVKSKMALLDQELSHSECDLHAGQCQRHADDAGVCGAMGAQRQSITRSAAASARPWIRAAAARFNHRDKHNMQRETPMDTSLRLMLEAVRAGLHMRPTTKRSCKRSRLIFSKGETRDKVERLQDYGFTGYFRQGRIQARPDRKKRRAFHAIHRRQSFISGLATLDDRRYRLRNFQEGEVAIYDDQQQKVHLQRERIYTAHSTRSRCEWSTTNPRWKGTARTRAKRIAISRAKRQVSALVNLRHGQGHITIERTTVIDDADDKEARSRRTRIQNAEITYRHAVARVPRQGHPHVLTPTISILWDEEKRKLVLNTEKTFITMEDKHNDDEGPYIRIQTEKTAVIMEDKHNNSDPYIKIQTPERSVTLDDKDKSIVITGTSTAIKVDDNIGRTRVGTTGANIPAAHLRSLVSSGDYICGQRREKSSGHTERPLYYLIRQTASSL